MTTTFDDHPHSAVIQIATGSSGAKRKVDGVYYGMNGKRLALEAAEPIPVSTPVSVEYDDALFLGEIVACSGSSNGAWKVEVKVEQVLTGLQSLIALRDRLLGEAVRQPVGLTPVGVMN